MVPGRVVGYKVLEKALANMGYRSKTTEVRFTEKLKTVGVQSLTTAGNLVKEFHQMEQGFFTDVKDTLKAAKEAREEERAHWTAFEAVGREGLQGAQDGEPTGR